jgi:ketopantoate reductase
VAVLRRAGIPLHVHGQVGGKPLETAIKAMRLPNALLAVVQRVLGVVKVDDPSYYSSIYFDLAAGRTTEVHELNGRIVALATAEAATGATGTERVGI